MARKGRRRPGSPASSFVASHPASAAPQPTCFREAGTDRRAKKANTLKGSSKADVIVGRDGNDRISGGGGADRICGGGGNDHIKGGGDNDQIDGGKGSDECLQEAGTGTKKNCEGPLFQLPVSKGGSGSGTVTSSPTGIDCGSSCSHGFFEAETVSLTASASPQSTFDG